MKAREKYSESAIAAELASLPEMGGTPREVSPELRARITKNLKAALKPVRPLASMPLLALQFAGVFALLAFAMVALMGTAGMASLGMWQRAAIVIVLAAGVALFSISLAWQIVPGSLPRMRAGLVLDAFACGFLASAASMVSLARIERVSRGRLAVPDRRRGHGRSRRDLIYASDPVRRSADFGSSRRNARSDCGTPRPHGAGIPVHPSKCASPAGVALCAARNLDRCWSGDRAGGGTIFVRRNHLTGVICAGSLESKRRKRTMIKLHRSLTFAALFAGCTLVASAATVQGVFDGQDVFDESDQGCVLCRVAHYEMRADAAVQGERLRSVHVR